MANLPSRLLRGLSKRGAAPNPIPKPNPAPVPAPGPNPITTGDASKITHAMDKLGIAAANEVTAAGISSSIAPTSITTTHAEKITHAVTKLTQAGLDDGTNSASHSEKHNPTKWIILGAVIGGVVLLSVLIGLGLWCRRYRRKKAYAVVSRGVDVSAGPNSYADEGVAVKGREEVPRTGMGMGMKEKGMGMFGGLLSKSKGKGKSKGNDPAMGSGALGTRNTDTDVFNADIDAEATEALSEGHRLRASHDFGTIPVIKETNFENGYDDVETEYASTRYTDGMPEAHGDKRAKFGP